MLRIAWRRLLGALVDEGVEITGEAEFEGGAVADEIVVVGDEIAGALEQAAEDDELLDTEVAADFH
jgi:hypothetical protein